MNELKVRIEDLTKGMILNESIYSESGILLLEKGTVLTKRLMDALSLINIETLEIFHSSMEGELVKVDMAFANRYYESATRYKAVYEQITIGQKLLYEEIEPIMIEIYHDIMVTENLSKKLWLLDIYDVYTFEHCVRVSIFSGLLGKWLGYSDKEIKECVLAGLLHDLGKANIPDQILNKPGPLSDEEFEVIKTHPKLGYSLISHIEVIPQTVKDAVLMHHEKMDGTGYPSGLKNNRISKLAKIIAISDVYCAMTANRIYKTARLPYDVLEIIREESFERLDYNIAKIFIHNIIKLHVGSVVVLTNNEVGEIIYIDEEEPFNLVVKVGHSLYELSENSDLAIKIAIDIHQ